MPTKKPRFPSRPCAWCGKEFVPTRVTQLSCSRPCGRDRDRQQKRERHHERWRTDPVHREKALAAFRQRYDSDPEFRVHRSQYNRAYQRQRRADDPAYRDLLNKAQARARARKTLARLMALARELKETLNADPTA